MPGTRGWKFDEANNRLEFYYDGTKVGHIDATNFVVSVAQSMTGGLTIATSGLTVTSGGATITAGDLTVTAGDAIVTAGALKVNVAAGDGIQERIGTVTDIVTAGAETYTAAQLATGLITRDPAGAGRTDTTDTATNLVAAAGLGLTANGDTRACYLINTADAAEAITLAGGTGVTVSNAGNTLLQNESAILLFRRTSATAVTLYVIGA